MSTYASQLLLLEDTSWRFYHQLLSELGRNGRHLRVSYNDGRLELFRRNNAHEQSKKLIGRFIEAYALEADIPLTAMGSPTLQAEWDQKGCEPDGCYYVTTPAPPMSAELEASAHPAPDLAIEIYVTHGAMNRLPILGAIGVREVWRFDGTSVSVRLLQDGRAYRSGPCSHFLPELPLDIVNRFARLAMKTSQGHAVLAFRDWLRLKTKI